MMGWSRDPFGKKVQFVAFLVRFRSYTLGLNKEKKTYVGWVYYLLFSPFVSVILILLYLILLCFVCLHVFCWDWIPCTNDNRQLDGLSCTYLSF